jgi:hypothetical protein
MKLRHFYLLACVLGTVLPLHRLYPFLTQHGLDLREFFAQVYGTSVGAFFASDVTCSAVILIVFMVAEGRRLGIRRFWLPVLGLLVGVSLALPWFLYVRQWHLDSRARSPSTREAVA